MRTEAQERLARAEELELAASTIWHRGYIIDRENPEGDPVRPVIFAPQASDIGGSVLSEHMETDRTSVSASERFDEAVELLHRLTSDEACRYDHNDFCQTHYDDRPCAHEEARAFLAEQEST